MDAEVGKFGPHHWHAHVPQWVWIAAGIYLVVFLLGGVGGRYGNRGRGALTDVFLFILAFFLPPLSVYLERGVCDKSVLIDFLLTLFGWLPGQLWALYVLIADRSSGTDAGMREPLV
ncbi:hypothetical protein WJX72_007501 [[Myrmecia] bisecta]|uniref:Uncharacterized protein n=1 Tax=[Myrmecia] bisecta TaxID=41462 RepID=A0AAW1R7D2_9CHLO